MSYTGKLPNWVFDKDRSFEQDDFIINWFLQNKFRLPNIHRFSHAVLDTEICDVGTSLLNFINDMGLAPQGQKLSYTNTSVKFAPYYKELNILSKNVNDEISFIMFNGGFLTRMDYLSPSKGSSLPEAYGDHTDYSCLDWRLYYDEHALRIPELVQGIERILEDFNSRVTYVKSKPTMGIITQKGNTLDLMQVDLLEKELSIEENYNDDFAEVHELILEKLNEDGKGLYLFGGDAGTGKTSYIRYLCGLKLKRKFIFLPPNMTNSLSSPDFITFIMKQKGCVLVIEDGENVLKKRQAGTSQEMSNLLNIADGLLSDVLGIAIICTFNSPLSEIDSALLRKGRLTVDYTFGKLNKDKANALARKLGVVEPNKDTVLTDVFNSKDRPATNKRERTQVGFNFG